MDAEIRGLTRLRWFVTMETGYMEFLLNPRLSDVLEECDDGDDDDDDSLLLQAVFHLISEDVTSPTGGRRFLPTLGCLFL